MTPNVAAHVLTVAIFVCLAILGFGLYVTKGLLIVPLLIIAIYMLVYSMMRTING